MRQLASANGQMLQSEAAPEHGEVSKRIANGNHKKGANTALRGEKGDARNPYRTRPLVRETYSAGKHISGF